MEKAIPSLSQFSPVLEPLMIIPLLLLFGPHLFNLIVKFVSSRPQQFHEKQMVMPCSQPLKRPAQRRSPTLPPDLAARELHSSLV